MSGSNYNSYQATEDERKAMEEILRETREQIIRGEIKSDIAANPPKTDNPTYATIPTRSSSQQAKVGTMANLEKLAGEIADMNYTDFTKGEDYASLTKRYSQQGKKAMDDTIGKVAARTGGLASSYATAAGNQAYSGYMEKLEDAARAMYDDQRQEKIDNFGIYKSLYDQEYQESRDRESDTRYLADRTSTMTADEKASLANELYYNANAYPTYADYKTAFPGTLLTEADFNQIKGTATGMYADNNKVVEPVDTGSLSDYQKMVIQQYNNAVGEDGTGNVPQWLQEEYEKIFGSPTMKKTYTEKIAAATTREEALEYAEKLSEIDEKAAEEALSAWEDKQRTNAKNRYLQKIATATTYEEALEFAMFLFELDENAANEALEAWEKAHPGYDKVTDPDDWKNVLPGHRPNSWELN